MGDRYGDLYGGMPPHVKDSDTSLAAAAKITSSVTTRRQAVLRFLRGRGSAGATDEQIQQALQMNPSTQRPRRIELVQLKHVRDSGRQRKTLSGRNAVVWIAYDTPDPAPVDERDSFTPADYRRATEGE